MAYQLATRQLEGYQCRCAKPLDVSRHSRCARATTPRLPKLQLHCIRWCRAVCDVWRMTSVALARDGRTQCSRVHPKFCIGLWLSQCRLSSLSLPRRSSTAPSLWTRLRTSYRQRQPVTSTAWAALLRVLVAVAATATSFSDTCVWPARCPSGGYLPPCFACEMEPLPVYPLLLGVHCIYIGAMARRGSGFDVETSGSHQP